jgi:hypothetical protein
VVCISAAIGARGHEVGRAAAAALAYRLIDEGIVLRAASEAGVEARVVANVERHRGFLARLLEDLGPSSEATAYSLGGYGPSAQELAAPGAADLRAMIRSAIEETAAAGESVIVGHAASAALKGHEGVLRVLVTASDETRRERISAERGVDGKQAAKVVHESDAARADYLKRFYGIHEELPVQYDLVLNTDNLSTARAAAILVSAANA